MISITKNKKNMETQERKQERKPFGSISTGDVVYLYDSNTNNLYVYAVEAIAYKPEQNIEIEVVRLIDKGKMLSPLNSDKETIETTQFMDVAHYAQGELWFANYTALSQFLEQRKRIAEQAIFSIGEAMRIADGVKDFKLKF